MIICHCNVVSDRQVRAAICDGADDVEEVTRVCGAGGNCGACRASIEAVLDEHCVPVLLRIAS